MKISRFRIYSLLSVAGRNPEGCTGERTLNPSNDAGSRASVGNADDAPLPYRPELDALRGLAVLAVVVHHCDLLPGGFLGVDLFFVLSGYLITGLLLHEHDRTGGIALGRFYLRRAKRLYPALLLMLGVYLLVAPRVWPGHPHGTDATWAALYLTDYTQSWVRWSPYLGHVWSLAVEEKFYLLWPPVLIAALGRGVTREGLARGLLWAIVVAVLWRSWEQAYFRFDARLPGLLAGCWLAAEKPDLPAWLGKAGAIVMVYVIAVSYGFGPWRLDLAVPVAEIASIGLVGCALPIRWPWLVWLGRLSYGVYLWHFPLSEAVSGMNPLAQLTLVLPLSLLAAWVSYWTVERVFRPTGKVTSPSRP